LQYPKKALAALLMICLFAFSSALVVNTARSQQKPYGGTLVIGATTIPMTPFNPPMQTDWSIFYAIWHVYGYLWDSDNEGRLIPDLAESYEVSPDGLTYTVHLFRNVTWHDGVPFTSEDVKWTVEVCTADGLWMGSLISIITDPSNETRSGLMVKPGAIETPDPYTVVFHLPTPYTPFPIMVGGITNIAVLPKHVLEGHDITTQEYINAHVVGTGPFKFGEYVPGDHITLLANENFHLGRPYLDRVIIKFYKNIAAAEIALRSGEVDLLPGIPVADVEALNGTGNIVVKSASQFGYNVMVYNLNPTLADGSPNPCAKYEVRKAIQQALNITAIVNSIDMGLGIPANQLSNPGAMGYNPDIPNPIFPYNVTAANELLDHAGYPRSAGSGTRFELSLYVDSSNLLHVKAAEIIQSYLEEVGIKVNIQLLESSTFYEMVTNAPQPKSFNCVISGFGWSLPFDYDYPAGTILGKPENTGPGGLNWGNYNNSQVNELILAAKRESDLQRREQMYKDVNWLLAHDLYYTFLDYPPAIWAYDKDFVWTPGPRDLGNISPNALREMYYAPLATTTTSPTTTQTGVGLGATEMVLAAAAIIVVVVGAVFVLVRRRKSAP
jgi:peptide/nickel transport system substrate-binding protein